MAKGWNQDTCLRLPHHKCAIAWFMRGRRITAHHQFGLLIDPNRLINEGATVDKGLDCDRCRVAFRVTRLI